MLDNGFLGRNFDCTFLVVPVNLNAVTRFVLKLFARGRLNSVLHGLDNHIAVQSLLGTQRLYTLSDGR